MKTYQHFRLWVIATILLCSSFVQAQVEQVNYELRYNPDSSYFDFYLHIITGSATSAADRTQFNAQISIVAPGKTKLKVKRSYMPLFNNPNPQIMSNELWIISTNWTNNNAIPINSFFSITPKLAPTSRYDTLYVGDKIKLFSLQIDSLDGCISDIRLYNHETDNPNFNGDFNHGFTMGGVEDLYAGNIVVNLPPIAGQDETLCYGGPHQLVAVGTNNGVWSVISPHNGDATVSNPSPGVGILNIRPSVSNTVNLLFRDSTGFDFKCLSVSDIALSINADSIPCSNALKLTAQSESSIISYLWTTNDISQTIIVNTSGTYNVTVTNENGCSSSISTTVIIDPFPPTDSIFFLSQNNICVGSTINAQSAHPLGTWVSSNPLVASVNSGMITGISQGTTTISYIYPSGCPAPNTLTVNVNPRPTVSSNSSAICVGAATGISPFTGGRWEVLTPGLGSVSANFIFTSFFPGIAELKFTETSTGCSNSLQIPILPRPEISVSGPTTICVGGTTTMSPSVGGSWSSSNGSVATVSNSGLVTGIALGQVTITFTNATTGCASLPSFPITVIDKPTVTIIGSPFICVGGTTSLSTIYAINGTWYSTNTSVASINPENGIVTGNASGFARFYFVSTNGCQSDNSLPITVNAPPNVVITGPSEICVGEMSYLSPTSGGTWSSTNPLISSVDNSGTVTALNPGAVSFTFTHASTGCISLPSNPITVLAKPLFSISKTDLEVGDITNLTSNESLTWFSTDESIAQIIQNNKISAKNTGACQIYATNSTGCVSDSITITVTDPKFTLVGYAFRDANSNGLFDSTIDSPLPNCAIHIPALNGIYFTDNTGFYNIQVLPGNYDVFFSISFGNWLSDSISFNIEIDKNVEYLFAAFVPLAQEPNSLISIHPSSLLCNTIADLDVSVFNNSSQKQSGYIALKVDEKTFAMNTVPFPIGTQGDYLIWEYLDILPGFSKTIKVGLDIPTPVSALDSMTFHAVSLSQAGDTLSQFYFHDTISCDVIDNNIRSWPDREGLANPTLRGESLNYHIKFENPNNETVNKVEIKNILDKHIDQSSILIKSSSHPVRSYVEDGYLYFVMDSIELVNRVLTPVKTGYVTFECTFDPMAADGTVIKNKAEITFNDNVNFPTNETINTIVSALPCTSIDLMETICPQSPLVTSQNVYYKEGFYIEIIKNDICDTIKTYRISLVAAPDGTLTAIDDKITAVEGAAKYNWYECGTNTILYSGTENIFTPSKSGQYYAIIQGVSCETKTECITISISSTTDLLEDQIKIFPNPTSNTITISSPYLVLNTKLLNTFGQLILVNADGNIDIGMLPNGVYILEIFTEKGKICKSVIKN